MILLAISVLPSNNSKPMVLSVSSLICEEMGAD